MLEGWPGSTFFYIGDNWLNEEREIICKTLEQCGKYTMTFS